MDGAPIICGWFTFEHNPPRETFAPHEQEDWMRRFINKISELASAARKSRDGELSAVQSCRNSMR
jgi:hypothetical protein